MYKLYYPQEFLFESSRSSLFPLLKPFLKERSFTNKERIEQYGVSDLTFSFVDDTNECDFIVLPMTWNYYKKNNLFDTIIKFIETNQNKTILSYTSGDFGVKTPNYSNLYVLRENGYRSKLYKNHIGIPVFIKDPLKNLYSRTEVIPLNYSLSPIVGFCGQSNFTFKAAVIDIIRVILKNTKYYLGLRDELPQRILSSSYLRGKILNVIKNSISIKDNFIERKKYRAGVKTNEDRIKTTQEFYDNIKDSHYIICLRGGGNFSVRIYETLAMGRIPLFINTDCLLPLDIDNEWKKHIVWVEEDNLHGLEDVLDVFHKKLSKDSLQDYLNNNREFWKEKLSLNGYFLNLFLKLK